MDRGSLASNGNLPYIATGVATPVPYLLSNFAGGWCAANGNPSVSSNLYSFPANSVAGCNNGGNWWANQVNTLTPGFYEATITASGTVGSTLMWGLYDLTTGNCVWWATAAALTTTLETYTFSFNHLTSTVFGRFVNYNALGSAQAFSMNSISVLKFPSYASALFTENTGLLSFPSSSYASLPSYTLGGAQNVGGVSIQNGFSVMASVLTPSPLSSSNQLVWSMGGDATGATGAVLRVYLSASGFYELQYSSSGVSGLKTFPWTAQNGTALKPSAGALARLLTRCTPGMIACMLNTY
jgi:hypothetical protein